MTLRKPFDLRGYLSFFKGEPSQSGTALLFVLGIVAVMSSIVIAIVFDTQRSLRYRWQRVGLLAARNLAEVGFKAGLMLLQYDYEEDTRYNQPADYFLRVDPQLGLDALKDIANRRELWSLFHEGSRGLAALFGIPVQAIPIGDYGSLELSITDLSSRYNIHRFHRAQGVTAADWEYKGFLHGLELLLSDLGGADPRTIFSSLLDWMDPDNEPFSAQGAESFYYQGLSPSYFPRNGPFFFPEEMRLVKGVDPEIYARLVTVITVYPYDLPSFGDYKVNINTALPQTLLFLDEAMDLSVAEALVEKRNEKPFTNPGQITKALQDMGKNDIANRVLGLIGVRSRAFLINSIGYTSDNRAILQAVVDRDPMTGVIRILSYQLRVL